MKKLFSIFLMLLLLGANSGVIFAAHYCMGSIADIEIGFVTKADPCEMVKKPTHCESHSSKEMKKKGCCEDEYVQLSSDIDFEKPSVSSLSVNPQFVIAWVLVLKEVNVSSEKIVRFNDYSPPLVNPDRSILYQSFLI